MRKALYKDLATAAGLSVRDMIQPGGKRSHAKILMKLYPPDGQAPLGLIVRMARVAYRWAALEMQWQETGCCDRWWDGSKPLRYSGPPSKVLPLKGPFPLQCSCGLVFGNGSPIYCVDCGTFTHTAYWLRS